MGRMSFASHKPRKPLATLSPREAEVLRLRKSGLTYKEVAKQLGISVHTCKAHVSHALLKLGAQSCLEAVNLVPA